MQGISQPLISFPQLFPGQRVEHDDVFARGIAAVRGIFNLAMALYLLAVIFPESDFPIIQRISTYAYVIFATVVTYPSRSGEERRAAATRHLVGFTIFTLGNAALSLLVWHQLPRALFWVAWLPGIYVDRATASLHTENVRRMLAVSSLLLLLVIVSAVGILLRRPATIDLLLMIPAAHVGSIVFLRLASSAGRYWAASLPHGKSSLHEPRDLARRELSAERAATQLQLERINRSLTMGALAASIAHEISQPLAAVLTNASAAANWLNQEQVDLVEARNAIGRVVEGGNRASAVIGSFRTMLRGDKPQRIPVQLHELMQEALTIRAPEIQKESITVLTPALESLSGVMGDPVQLRQVFLNLITNAIDALAEVIDRPRLLIVHCEEDDNLCAAVTVEDNGPGLATKDPAKIFEPFFSTKSQGMGMGLFISRMIVEAHGGNLKVKSHPGRTTFHVCIPARYLHE